MMSRSSTRMDAMAYSLFIRGFNMLTLLRVIAGNPYKLYVTLAANGSLSSKRAYKSRRGPLTCDKGLSSYAFDLHASSTHRPPSYKRTDPGVEGQEPRLFTTRPSITWAGRSQEACLPHIFVTRQGKKPCHMRYYM